MILDADTLALVPGVEALLESVEGRELPGVVKMELLASMVELATDVCATSQQALASLEELRKAADEGARAGGLRIAAAGTHPFSLPEAQDIAPDPRYREFVEYAGITARRQAVCGLHVHVSMPSAEACMHALEGVLPWLPLVLAQSANSPYLAGEETGLMSARAEVLGLLPRAAAPPVFASYEEWEAFVERFVEIGLADGYTRFWWDIRPHPKFGTLEVRAPDQPTSVALDDGLLLRDAYVAAAVRCAPPANKPTPAERDTCAPFLHRELALLERVRVIVALGSFGYEAIWAMLRASDRADIEMPRRRPRFTHLLEVPCGRVTVLGAFHPSQQNTFTGKLTPDMLDAVFERAAELRSAR